MFTCYSYFLSSTHYCKLPLLVRGDVWRLWSWAADDAVCSLDHFTGSIFTKVEK